jgi:Leucine-rich repeat (LRR) protein
VPPCIQAFPKLTILWVRFSIRQSTIMCRRSLEYNLITSIVRSELVLFNDLQILFLRNNLITELPSDLFSASKNLSYLYAS